jgi:CHASE2 domain-containing sensor protein
MAHLFSNPELRRATVVALLRIEGISILALGLFLIIKGLVDGRGIEWFVISGILALAIVGGLGLLLAAKGFKSKKMYGRAPAVLANLIAIGVSKYIFEAGFWWAALPLTLYAALTIYCAVSLVPEKN